MDIAREFRFLQQKVSRLEAESTDTAAKVRGINMPPTHQSLLVKATADIGPDSSGPCICVSYIVSQSSGETNPKKQEIPQVKVYVYNNRATPIWKDEELLATRDAFGNYYKINSVENTAFFLTGDEGIPAASGQFNPQSAECERHYFNKPAGVIDPAVNPDDGSPVFETVYNHTTTAVAADKLIQAKRIDGAWFIDVEPC